MEKTTYTPHEQVFIKTRETVQRDYEILMEEGSEYPLLELPINFNEGPIRDVVEGRAADPTRFKNMLLLYFFAPELNKKQIGQLHGVTGEAARLDIEHAYSTLRREAVEDEKAQFPIMEKPEIIGAAAINRNGPSSQIYQRYLDMSQNGHSTEEVFKALQQEFTSGQIKNAFRKFGIDLHPTHTEENKDVIEKLQDKNTTEKDIRALLTNITPAFLSRYRELFLSPSDITKAFPLLYIHSRNTQQFVKKLEELGIPFARVLYKVKSGDKTINRYRYATIKDRYMSRIEDIIKKSDQLADFWFTAA